MILDYAATVYFYKKSSYVNVISIKGKNRYAVGKWTPSTGWKILKNDELPFDKDFYTIQHSLKRWVEKNGLERAECNTCVNFDKKCECCSCGKNIQLLPLYSKRYFIRPKDCDSYIER